MTEKQLKQASNIYTELSQLNRITSCLERAHNDEYSLKINSFVNLALYLTAEEQNDIIQRIKQYIKAHRDQKQQEFAAL